MYRAIVNVKSTLKHQQPCTSWLSYLTLGHTRQSHTRTNSEQLSNSVFFSFRTRSAQKSPVCACVRACVRARVCNIFINTMHKQLSKKKFMFNVRCDLKVWHVSCWTGGEGAGGILSWWPKPGHSLLSLQHYFIHIFSDTLNMV